jgi:hypothetical protein
MQHSLSYESENDAELLNYVAVYGETKFKRLVPPDTVQTLVLKSTLERE